MVVATNWSTGTGISTIYPATMLIRKKKPTVKYISNFQLHPTRACRYNNHNSACVHVCFSPSFVPKMILAVKMLNILFPEELVKAEKESVFIHPEKVNKNILRQCLFCCFFIMTNKHIIKIIHHWINI